MRIIRGLEELHALVGQEVSVSEWLEVAQERVGLFAEATGDDQWIHVDVERARRESPFGGPVAHGFLTLALLSKFAAESFRLEGFRMGVNYGLNRVRFPAPVPVGARIRARFTLAEAREIEGGVQMTWTAAVEVEGGSKPCLAAEWLTRAYR